MFSAIFFQIRIIQGSPKFTRGLKTAYFIYHVCLEMCGVVLFTTIFDCALLDIDHKICSIPFIGVSIIVYLKCICQGSPKFTIGQKTAYFIYHVCLEMCGVVFCTTFFYCALLDIDHKICSIPFIGVSIIVYLKCICQGSPKFTIGQKNCIFHIPWVPKHVWCGFIYHYFLLCFIGYWSQDM